MERPELSQITPEYLESLSDEDFKDQAAAILELVAEDRRENQLLYYQPASDQARKVHFSRAKYVGISGGNGCAALDSPVLMADESWKPLGEIVVGDMVMAVDPGSLAHAPSRVLNTFRSGKNQLHRVDLADGRWFELTENHKLPIWHDGALQKKLLKDILEATESIPILTTRGDRPWVKATTSRIAETGDIEVDHPAHCYVIRDNVVVSNSSKTETALVQLIALATGVLPEDPEINEELRAQFRGPIKARVVVESHTTVLEPIILPKLKYHTWTGVDRPGGERGHWGWVPKTSLIEGQWDKSWREKTKMLTVWCKDPESGSVLGKSTIQFMSKSQDPEDFASGDFEFILHDEPPLLAQWRESQARTMRVDGRIFLSFTWPDDPSIPVDWIFDEMYDKQRDEDHDWFVLWTTENRTLNQDAVAKQAENWDEATKEVRLRGGSMRFSNRVHPLFTDTRQTWCFNCNESIYSPEGVCSKCGGDNTVDYNHVQSFEPQKWPCVFMLDPHPRKPHMFMWVMVTPNDDLMVVAEGELADTPEAVAKYVLDFEADRGFHVPLRMIDPNMGRSPSGTNREQTWQDEFDNSGLVTELADDSSVGRQKVDEYLKPDPYTHCPRLVVHESCHTVIYQMKRYVWQDFKTSLERDVKQVPRDKYDDYPTLLKYLVNFNPQFSFLHSGAPVIHRRGTRQGAY